jgi:hypothetical protein
MSAGNESRKRCQKITHPLRASRPESVWLHIGLLFFSDCLSGWRRRRSRCNARTICLWGRLRKLQPQSVGGIVRHGGRMGPSLVEPDRGIAIKLPKKEHAISSKLQLVLSIHLIDIIRCRSPRKYLLQMLSSRTSAFLSVLISTSPSRMVKLPTLP